MRLSLLCRVGNATARAVGCCDRAALRLTLRTNCSLPLAPPVARPSSVGLGAAKRPQQVSNLGRVRTAYGIITEGTERTDGYRTASINGKSHYVHRLVAYEFLPPPPSEKHRQVNHKDGNPANNRADNLEWVTPAKNNQHSHDTNADRKSSAPKQSKPVLGGGVETVEYESGNAAARALELDHGNVNLAWATPAEKNQHSHYTNADRKSNAPKQSKPVLGRRHGSEEEWVEYESSSAAARELGLNPGSISACCRGKQKRTGDYEFKLAPLAEDQLDKPGEVWREIQIKAK